MANNVFKFKQFEVDQSGCAMKINTDGVLLGAIANRAAAPLRVLDIGTGTGVIALMLAQRFETAMVDAVEIDEFAAVGATANARGSVFADRVRIIHDSVANLSVERYPDIGKYDMVVSNPPYFVNDLKSADNRKGLARHADELFFAQMLERVSAVLSDEGCFWFILPVKQAEELVQGAVAYGLKPVKRIYLHSDETKAAFRHIICLDSSGAELQEEHLCIYKERGVHTHEYKQLLKDFFLAF